MACKTVDLPHFSHIALQFICASVSQGLAVEYASCNPPTCPLQAYQLRRRPLSPTDSDEQELVVLLACEISSRRPARQAGGGHRQGVDVKGGSLGGCRRASEQGTPNWRPHFLGPSHNCHRLLFRQPAPPLGQQQDVPCWQHCLAGPSCKPSLAIGR